MLACVPTCAALACNTLLLCDLCWQIMISHEVVHKGSENPNGKTKSILPSPLQALHWNKNKTCATLLLATHKTGIAISSPLMLHPDCHKPIYKQRHGTYPLRNHVDGNMQGLPHVWLPKTHLTATASAHTSLRVFQENKFMTVAPAWPFAFALALAAGAAALVVSLCAGLAPALTAAATQAARSTFCSSSSSHL